MRGASISNSLRRSLWNLIAASLVLCSVAQQAWTQVCASAGRNGPATLVGVVNTYHPGAATASASATSIQLGAAAIGGASTSISTGDLLLVIQMQDAAINSSNGTAYGANDGTGRGATNINNSGRYEYVVATNSAGLGGGVVTIRGTGAGNGLLYTYTNAAATGTQGQRRFQVVRVPQYSSATLTSSLTAAPWNGSTGGVLAFDVAGQLALNSATASLNGLGFRGGGGRRLVGGSVSGTAPTNTDYRFLASTPVSSTVGAHGSKGEGIAGTPRYVFDAATNSVMDTGAEGYPNGSYARGAPGNAGGGGTDSRATFANEENAGGGGGGNGGIGGIGGNTWRTNLATGGIGGSVVANAAGRVVMGGGGGAGSRNDSIAFDSSGAAGGGIVLIRTGTINGSGSISANGGDAHNNTANDGGGGGGAGGSVVVSASGSLAGLTILARGGRGGNAWATQAPNGNPGDRHGPGGGGAGGFIAITGGASLDVSGGVNGTTTTANSAYGATAGSTGATLAITQGQIPGVDSGAECLPVLTVTKTTSTATVNNGSSGTTATYTITVLNAANRSAATNVSLSDALPPSFTYKSTGAINLGGGATRPTITNPTLGDVNPAWSLFIIPASGQVQLTFTVDIASIVAGGTYQNPATATYLDPTRAIANGTASTNYNSASSTGEDVTVVAPPNIVLVKSCSSPINCTTQAQLPGTDLVYLIAFTNSGSAPAASITITDSTPANTDFKVGSAATTLGTTGLTVIVTYSNDGGTLWTYTPASGSGGAPAGYDRTVTHSRWTFAGNLSPTAPNNTGNIGFTVRIR